MSKNLYKLNGNKLEWRPLRPFAAHNNIAQNLGIYSEEDFEHLLNYERIRSERTESNFSLVIFEVERTPANRNGVKGFVDDIRAKVRIIDHVGWFKDHVSVLLPETSGSEAVLFINALRTRAGAEKLPVVIYSHLEDENMAQSVLNENSNEKWLDPADDVSLFHKRVIHHQESASAAGWR